MIRFKRRNTLWLATLGAMLALVILSSSVSASGQVLLLAGFVLALIASVLDLQEPRQFIQSLQQRTSRSRVSPQAQEALARARGRAEYQETDLQMIDVGVIATQSGREGMVMRRTRRISRDDDGVRPFVTLLVPGAEADRNAEIRFEITNQTGKDLYVHEMDVFLRDGEMNILTEDHLPLANNEQVAGMGDWDLRVTIDGTLIGVHTFTLTPSIAERRRRLLGGREEPQHFITGAGQPEEREEAQEPREEAPMSLEDLLRNQGPKRS